MLEYALAILGAWRLAHMLALEEGPGGVFHLVRERFDAKQETWLGRGLNCPLCIGFWCSYAIAWLMPAAGLEGFLLNILIGRFE
jgi:hypothetical protein